MRNVRVIYEQIETAKAHLLKGDLLNSRLALILLDNAAELILTRQLRHVFGFDDMLYRPEDRLEEARRENRVKYTAEERSRAEWEFEPKLRILGFRLNQISTETRGILKVCHRLRCEAFHAGRLRATILRDVAVLLFQTTVRLTVELPPYAMVLAPRPTPEEAQFLERLNLAEAMQLMSKEGCERAATKLLEGVELNVAEFSAMLSTELIERIDESILGGLEYLNERNGDIDRNLQYKQFWNEYVVPLPEEDIPFGRLEEEFERWKAQGRAKYTLAKIQKWHRQAELIARRDRPSKALEEWWALDNTIEPLEIDIGKAVGQFDDEIDAQIRDRR